MILLLFHQFLITKHWYHHPHPSWRHKLSSEAAPCPTHTIASWPAPGSQLELTDWRMTTQHSGLTFLHWRLTVQWRRVRSRIWSAGQMHRKLCMETTEIECRCKVPNVGRRVEAKLQAECIEGGTGTEETCSTRATAARDAERQWEWMGRDQMSLLSVHWHEAKAWPSGHCTGLGTSLEGAKKDILTHISNHFEANPSLCNSPQYEGLFNRCAVDLRLQHHVTTRITLAQSSKLSTSPTTFQQCHIQLAPFSFNFANVMGSENILQAGPSWYIQLQVVHPSIASHYPSLIVFEPHSLVHKYTNSFEGIHLYSVQCLYHSYPIYLLLYMGV